MGMIQRILMGAIIVSIVILLFMSAFFEGTNTLNLPNDNPTLADINSTIYSFKDTTSGMMGNVSSQSLSQNTSSVTDNPLVSLSTSVFNVIPLTFNIVTFFPSLVNSFLGASGLQIPSYIFGYIVLIVEIVIIFAFVNWIRSGAEGL